VSTMLQSAVKCVQTGWCSCSHVVKEHVFAFSYSGQK